MALTLHVLPASWDPMVEVSLGVLHLPTPHNAKNISNKIRQTLLELGWDGEGEATLTTDSAAVMAKSARRLKWEWIPCMCHILHNAAQYGLKALGAEVDMKTENATLDGDDHDDDDDDRESSMAWDPHEQDVIGG